MSDELNEQELESLGIEIIDADMVIPSREKKTKKTPSLFDTPLADRTYWGNDKGTELLMALARNAIRRSVRSHTFYDVKDNELTRKLTKEKQEELMQYQFDLIKSYGE